MLLSVSLSVDGSSVCACLFVCLFVCLLICLSVDLSVCLSHHPSVCLSASCWSVCLLLCLHLFVYLSVCLSVYLSACGNVVLKGWWCQVLDVLGVAEHPCTSVIVFAHYLPIHLPIEQEGGGRRTRQWLRPVEDLLHFAQE